MLGPLLAVTVCSSRQILTGQPSKIPLTTGRLGEVETGQGEAGRGRALREQLP